MVFTTEIQLPNNVQVTKQSNFVMFHGPLGINKISLKKIDTKGIGAIKIKKDQANRDLGQIRVYSPSKCFCGLVSTIIKNKIQGVSRGFLIYIRV